VKKGRLVRFHSLVCTILGASVALPAGALAPPAVAAPPPLSATQKNIETAGTAIAIAVPLFAGGLSLYRRDWTGVAQLTADTVLTVGTAYALKNFVRERRPDGSDYHSFPSGTTALSASGSSYLWDRYGWSWGLPAFAASQFVSYSRIQAKQHHWYDTLASSALGIGYGYLVTSRYRGHFSSDLSASPEGGYLRLSYAW